MNRGRSPNAAAWPIAFGRSFGWLYPAAGQRGVVLCGPNGYEEICCHRAWAQFAQELAASGLPTLRFDYPGAGDSPGNEDAPQLIRSWLDGIRDAVALMRRQPGVTEVALVGLRLGATLAAAAAQELAEIGQGVESVVLLAPVSSGASYCKELRVLSMLAKAQRILGSSDTPGLQAAGFHYTPSTIAELKALDPAATPIAPAPRVLHIDRGNADGAANLAAAFRNAGAELAESPFADYTLLMRDPELSEYPPIAFRHAVDWLRQDAPAAETVAVDPPAPAEIAVPGGVERAVWIDGEVPLFGIFGEPRDPGAARPALLIFNTGATHHIGANRLSVEIARRLLRIGVATLRIDVAGVGDSPSLPGRPDKTETQPELVTDARLAVGWLKQQGYDQIIVTGLCSGGWLAYHTALEDSRVAGQILLNLQNLWQPPSFSNSMESSSDYLRLLRRLSTWRRLASGQVRVRAIAAVLLARIGKAIRTRIDRMLRRVSGGETVEDRARAELRMLAGRGIHSIFVYVEGDMGLEEIRLHFGRRGQALVAESNVHITIVEGVGHLFAMKRPREQLVELIARQFQRGSFAPAVRELDAVPNAAGGAIVRKQQLPEVASRDQ